MMMTLVLLLTAATVVVELMMLYRSGTLVEVFKRNSLAAIVSSVALSWVLGSLFSAAGLVVLLAAVASTIVTALVCQFPHVTAASQRALPVSGDESTSHRPLGPCEATR